MLKDLKMTRGATKAKNYEVSAFDFKAVYVLALDSCDLIAQNWKPRDSKT